MTEPQLVRLYQPVWTGMYIAVGFLITSGLAAAAVWIWISRG